jgi:hypothetical protein
LINLFFYFLQKYSHSVIIDESNSKSNSFSVLESISSSQHNDNVVQNVDSQNYLCEICNEKYIYKKNYDRHLSSRKHSNKLVELNSEREMIGNIVMKLNNESISKFFYIFLKYLF